MNKTGKTLRVAAIVLMAMTAAMNILGGLGTTCAAFLTRSFPPMWDFYPYRFLYQGLVIITVAIGVLGIIFTIGLSKGNKNAFRNALIILVIGTIFAGIQYFASLAIRGKAAPANVKFFTNVLTLIVFLIILIPGIRKSVGFERKSGAGRSAGGALAAIVAGLLILSTPMWAASSHTYRGENWVLMLDVPLLVAGVGLTLAGVVLLIKSSLRVVDARELSVQTSEE